MDDLFTDSKQSASCAKALFSLCVIVIVATWFLNRSIGVHIKLRDEQRSRYENTENMLGKLKAVQSLGPGLFEDLTWCAIRGPGGYESMVHHSLYKGEVAWYMFGSSQLGTFDKSELHEAVRKFSKRASEIVVKEKATDVRIELLKKATTECFGGEKLKKLADAYVFTRDKGPLGLTDYALQNMAQVDSPEAWPAIVTWMVYSEWPPWPVSGITGSSEGTVSYFERFPARWTSANQRQHDYQQIIAAGPVRAEEILTADWNAARDALVVPFSRDSAFAISGTTVSLTITDLLITSSPILVFIQCMYLVFTRRASRGTQESKDVNGTFGFPRFGCGRDPMRLPWPQTLPDFVERATWFTFLALPSLILSFAVLTRYDISTVTHAHVREPILQSLLFARGIDPKSNWLDVMNVCCFAAAMYVMLDLTRHSGRGFQPEPQRLQRFVRAGWSLIAAPFLGLAIAILKWNPQKLKWIPFNQAVFVGIFLLVVLGFATMSMRRRSATGVSVAALCLILTLVLAL